MFLKKLILLISLWWKKSEWARERTADLGLFGRRIYKDWMYENREKKKSIDVHTQALLTQLYKMLCRRLSYIWYRNVCILQTRNKWNTKFRNKLYLMLIRTDGTRMNEWVCVFICTKSTSHFGQVEIRNSEHFCIHLSLLCSFKLNIFNFIYFFIMARFSVFKQIVLIIIFFLFSKFSYSCVIV
jgi:hypothetical protein